MTKHTIHARHYTKPLKHSHMANIKLTTSGGYKTQVVFAVSLLGERVNSQLLSGKAHYLKPIKPRHRKNTEK